MPATKSGCARGVLVAVAVAVLVGVLVTVSVGGIGVLVGVFVGVSVGMTAVLVGVSVAPVGGVAVTQTMGSPAVTGDDPPAVSAAAIAITTVPTINTRNNRCMEHVLSEVESQRTTISAATSPQALHVSGITSLGHYAGTGRVLQQALRLPARTRWHGDRARPENRRRRNSERSTLSDPPRSDRKRELQWI